MNGTTRLRLTVAALLVAGTALATTSAVDAGDLTPFGLDVSISVSGPGAQAVLDGLTVEVYTDPGGVLVDPLNCASTPTSTGEFGASEAQDCGIASGDYIIGLDGVPDEFSIGGSCSSGISLTEPLDLAGAESFSYDGGPTEAMCSLFLRTSILLIDKVVVGGDASSSDFVIDIVDSGGTSVATGSDVADATCEADFDTANCGVIAVPDGQGFQIAEPTVENYELTSVECDEFVNAAGPPDGGAVVSDIGADGFRTDDGDTYCVVTNTFVTPTTTTTTTTTTPTTTTTVAPTTTLPAPTTTAVGVAVVTLPETGTSATANAWMVAVAVLLIAAGGAMVGVRRRPA